MQIYIGNIPETASEQDIKDHFAAYSADKAKIIKDHATGKSRGFGLVNLPIKNIQKAIDEMNNTEFMNNVIRVNRMEHRSAGKQPEQKDAWKYKHIDNRYR